MTVTLTANYKEIFSAVTVDKIDELLDENYALDDMLEFIDEHSESEFVTHYEDYSAAGESIGYDVVDAYIKENDFYDVDTLIERYRGCYESNADFAEQWYNDTCDVPDNLVIDWDATYDQHLHYDHTSVEVSYREFHFFTDN